MKAILLALAAALALASSAIARPPQLAPYPAAAQTTQARLLPYVRPAVKDWIVEEGQRLAAGQGDPGAEAAAAAAKRFPNATPDQRNAVAFLALMRAADTLKNQPDSTSELGETESLRLQMAMDRHSKLMTTLSNLLKKMSDTDAGIIQNIK
jgi:hypothetical protein